MMNLTEARMLREAHNAYVRRISRKSRAALAIEYRADLADRGMISLFGGPVPRDEVIRALVELHYPAAKCNEAAHVIGHDTHGWSACNFCHDDDGTHAGGLCECDRHAETDCIVCGRMAAFHFRSTYTRGGGQRPTLADHGMLGHAYQGRMVTAVELVWCELVNAPAHEGTHALLPNCRHPHNAGEYPAAPEREDAREIPWLGDVDRRADDDVEFCTEDDE